MQRKLRPLRAVPCLLAIAALVMTGCTARDVRYVSTAEFPETAPESVRILARAPERPVIVVAQINSDRAGDQTLETRRAQLEDLRDAAARLGAEAVVDVMALTEYHDGFVADLAAPVPAWKPGSYELYFLRGTAVRWAEGEQTEPAFEPESAAANLESIREVISRPARESGPPQERRPLRRAGY